MTTVATPALAAEHSRAIPASVLHAVHARVRARCEPTYALHVGEPHVTLPDTAAEAICRAIRDRETSYGDAAGLPVLRERLSSLLGSRGPLPPDVFVTPGSSEALAATLLSLARPGGAVLLPSLHWPIHLQQARLSGLEPIFFSAQGRSLVDALEAAYQPSVCCVVLNSPSNPTGAVLTRAETEEAHAWASARGVWIISDEAYEDFVFEGEPPSFWEHDGAVAPEDRIVFSVHTFSKSYSMTGCRLGYVAPPTAERAALLARVQEAVVIAPSTPVQHGGLAALDDTAHVARHHDYVRHTRDAVIELLAGSGLLYAVPAGGWYALVDLSPYTDDVESLCNELLAEIGVALAPGSAFMAPHAPASPELARISLCGEREATITALRLLRDHLGAA